MNEEERVNHPKHYTWLRDLAGIEVIDLTRHFDFDLGNALKYILRSGKKKITTDDEKAAMKEDLQKAVWYLNDKINNL